MRIQIDQKRIKLYLYTGLFFLLLWTLGELILGTAHFFLNILGHIWILVYLTGINFILFEYSLPFIQLRWKRLLLAPLIIFGHVLLISFGNYAWRKLGISLNILQQYTTFSSIEAALERMTANGLFSAICYGVVRYTYDQRQLKLMAQQLRIEKQEAELHYLRAQTNPHFLFNTLNNIYALTREKSDLAPESVLRLSKILRFMLYETGGTFISIAQELAIISDYIELEKLRYDDSLRISFSHHIEDQRQAIPPLLLIPLVENAFKHGVSETLHQPFIDIHITVSHHLLKGVVKNSSEQEPGNGPVKDNIGLTNLRRQLELLYKDYQLTTAQQNNIFTATLIIQLNSHA